jgi:tRNA1(Val) A37 N6-methylase TrmN6
MSEAEIVSETDTTDDAVLGGRLVLRQPRKGHRFGHDAILLAAATPARPGDHVVELGAGVGAAGLALARRVAALRVTLAEIDAALCALARHNAKANGLAEQVEVVCVDVASDAPAFDAALLPAGAADQVLMNPPFNPPFNPSPEAGRRLAHTASAETLTLWMASARRLLRSEGGLTLIWRADGLDGVLTALAAHSFGAASVLPVYPKPQSAAIRVLVHAVADRAAGPPSVLPGLVLADANGAPAPATEAVLRACHALPLVG